MKHAPCSLDEVEESTPSEPVEIPPSSEAQPKLSRRTFVMSAGALGVGVAAGAPRIAAAQAEHQAAMSAPKLMDVTLKVNGKGNS